MARSAIYFERSHFHAHRNESFLPPLVVTTAGFSRWGPGDGYSLDARKHFSLNLVTAGQARFEQQGRIYRVAPGEIFLSHVEMGQCFFTGETGRLCKRFLILKGSHLPSLLQSAGLHQVDVVTGARSRSSRDVFKQCYALLRDKPSGFALRLSTLAYGLLLEMGQAQSRGYPDPLSEVMAFMGRRLQSRVALAEVARVAGMSPRHLSRLFHRHLGMSPLQFHLRQKLAWGENLLQTSNLSIKEISQTLGYDEPLYFSAQFRRHAGCSPKAFRQRYPGGTRLASNQRA